jgi:hypothetical protein
MPPPSNFMAKRIVLFQRRTAKVKLVRALGAPAEQIVYPNRGQGFDLSDPDPVTTDAVEGVVRFFQIRRNQVCKSDCVQRWADCAVIAYPTR